MKLTEEQELIAKEWIAALRSGKYKQGKGYLQRDGEFCCLGVLCDIHASKTDTNQWSLATGSLDQYEYQGIISYPPIKVLEWAGVRFSISTKAPFSGEDLTLPFCDWLVNLNDSQKKDFNDIADFIEKTLLEATND